MVLHTAEIENISIGFQKLTIMKPVTTMSRTDSPPVEPAIAVLPENSSTTPTQAESLLPHHTRSGRNVRPPLRYGQT